MPVRSVTPMPGGAPQPRRRIAARCLRVVGGPVMVSRITFASGPARTSYWSRGGECVSRTSTGDVVWMGIRCATCGASRAALGTERRSR